MSGRADRLAALGAALLSDRAGALAGCLAAGEAGRLSERLSALLAAPRQDRLAALRAALPPCSLDARARAAALAAGERPRVADLLRRWSAPERERTASPLLAPIVAGALSPGRGRAAAGEPAPRTARRASAATTLGDGAARAVDPLAAVPGFPLQLPSVSGGFAALGPAARQAGRRAAEGAAAALAEAIGGPVEIAGRPLAGNPDPLLGTVRLGLSLAAVPADATLEVEASLAARLLDRLAGGDGNLPPALEATPAERATAELLALVALSGAASAPPVAALSPRLVEAAHEPAGALAVELVLTAGRARGACRLLLPEAAVRALSAAGDLPAAVAAWPVEASLRSGFAALPEGALALLEAGDVLLLDEPPSTRALLRLPGPALRGRHEDGHFHVEEMAVTDDAAALPLTIAVELARVPLTLGELARLEPGAALPLHAPRDGRVVLRLGDRAVARGQLVEIEGALGVRVDDLEARP